MTPGRPGGGSKAARRVVPCEPGSTGRGTLHTSGSWRRQLARRLLRCCAGPVAVAGSLWDGPQGQQMTERETTGAETRPPGPGPQPRPAAAAPWRGRLALIAGSTTTLVAASLLGSALGFLNKAACRGGDWNIYLKQFQAHCYTDIYPLYYNEGLSAGKVPYTGHPVEYPVLIGAAMQAAAWVVRPISDAGIRGREFFDVTVVLLALCALAGTLATAYLAGPSRRWTALLVALAPGPDPGLLHQLGPDRDGAGRAGHGGLGRAPPGPGRGAARPGGGDQVLPAGLLRPAAAAVPAGGQAAGVHRDRGLRRGGLARRERAAMEHYGVEPDLIVVAKSIAAGLPLSGVVGKAAIMDAPHSGAIGGTYIGNPIAPRRRARRPRRLRRGRARRPRQHDRRHASATAMLAWQERWPQIGDVRGLGAMLAIELVHDPATKEPARSSPPP